jgi:hypothetical protein
MKSINIALLTEGGLAPVKSINIALLTEGELALWWINPERQDKNTNTSPFNHTREGLTQNSLRLGRLPASNGHAVLHRG